MHPTLSSQLKSLAPASVPPPTGEHAATTISGSPLPGAQDFQKIFDLDDATLSVGDGRSLPQSPTDEDAASTKTDDHDTPIVVEPEPDNSSPADGREAEVADRDPGDRGRVPSPLSPRDDRGRSDVDSIDISPESTLTPGEPEPARDADLRPRPPVETAPTDRALPRQPETSATALLLQTTELTSQRTASDAFNSVTTPQHVATTDAPTTQSFAAATKTSLARRQSIVPPVATQPLKTAAPEPATIAATPLSASRSILSPLTQKGMTATPPDQRTTPLPVQTERAAATHVKKSVQLPKAGTSAVGLPPTERRSGLSHREPDNLQLPMRQTPAGGHHVSTTVRPHSQTAAAGRSDISARYPSSDISQVSMSDRSSRADTPQRLPLAATASGTVIDAEVVDPALSRPERAAMRSLPQAERSSAAPPSPQPQQQLRPTMVQTPQPPEPTGASPVLSKSTNAPQSEPKAGSTPVFTHTAPPLRLTHPVPQPQPTLTPKRPAESAVSAATPKPLIPKHQSQDHTPRAGPPLRALPSTAIPVTQAQPLPAIPQTLSEIETFDPRPTELLSTQGRADGPAAQTAPGHAPPSPRADLPLQIARQLAEVASQLPNRPVDITLSPEELGRVRMSLSLTETGVVVSLTAERPETMDLMRRHIDQLGQDFLSLGFDDIAFSFEDQDESAEPDDHSGSTPQDPVAGDQDDTPLQIHLRNGAPSGLDLRL